MTARWWRANRANVQLVAGGLAILALGGVAGHLMTPPRTVEVRTVVTQPVPPVCEAALASVDVALLKQETVTVQGAYNRDHTGQMLDARIEGDADTADREHALANEAGRARDEADLARLSALQAYQEYAAQCRAHRDPVRVVERVAR